MLNIALPNIAEAQSNGTSAHERQLSQPEKMLELEVEQSTTAIVTASNRDLNVIYTPFNVVKITHNSVEQFKIDKDKIYFQASSKEPFSIFTTEEGDHKAPQFKIMFVPGDMPVGQQIRLVPKEPYVPKQLNKTSSGSLVKKSDNYTQSIIQILASTARYLATYKTEMLPEGFVLDDEYASAPYYIGNAVMKPEMKLHGTHFDVYIITANNRANTTLQLSASDFAKMTPATGLLDESTIDTMASGVGFYPRKVIQPGQSTQIILLRPSTI